MFLLDDVLLAPGKAAFVLFQELARQAQDEWLNDDAIKQELQQLYQMLEGGRISEQEFDAKEGRLLERLDQIARIKLQDTRSPDIVVESVGEPSAAPVAALVAEPAALPSAQFPALPPAALPALPPPLPPVPPPPPPEPAAPVAPVAPVFVAQPPVVQAPSLPPVPPPAVAAPPVQFQPLTMTQIIDCAVRALSIMKMRVSSVTSVVPEDSSWRVSIELVERRGIPDTSDVLGLYEVRLDAAGNVLRYERTQMRRRCDFAR